MIKFKNKSYVIIFIMFKNRINQSLRFIRLYSTKLGNDPELTNHNAIFNFKALEERFGIPYIHTKNFLLKYHDKLSRLASNNYGLVSVQIGNSINAPKAFIPYMFPLKYNPSPQFVSKVRNMRNNTNTFPPMCYGTMRATIASMFASFIYFSYYNIDNMISENDSSKSAIDYILCQAFAGSIVTGIVSSSLYITYSMAGTKFIIPIIALYGIGKIHIHMLKKYVNDQYQP
jgi:hypothetical protein